MGGSLVGGASGMKEVRLPRAAQNLTRRESYKEGPACGRMPYEQSHKEGPTPVGGCLVGGAFGMKDIRVPGSVQNVKRQKIFTDERRIKIKIQREELCCRQEKKEN